MPNHASLFAAALPRRRWLSPAVLLGLVAVLVARLLTLPHGPWEQDEVLFVRGVERFAPLEHRPHPPGYPVVIGLGKLIAALSPSGGDAFSALVASSVVASLVGYLALAVAFRALAGALVPAADADRIGVAGALLMQLSPAMLVYGPLALSDAPAVMFLSLMIAGTALVSAGARELGGGGSAGSGSTTGEALATARAAGPALLLGGAAAAAIGCRPQLLPAVGVAFAAALWITPAWRQRRLAAGAFLVAALAWGLPLLAATGGPRPLLDGLAKQAATVARFDAGIERAEASWTWVATRFIAHPWGARGTSIPMLALAGAGGVAVAAIAGHAARLALLPLLGLAVADLLLGIGLLHPDDAVRYALPSLLLVAFLAALGLSMLARRLRAPRTIYAGVGLLAFGFSSYCAPLLRVRTQQPSPAAQAASWAVANLPASSAVLFEGALEPFASEYLARFELAPVRSGLDRFALRADVPLWLYGDGPSSWPGAVTFAWPSSDAYGKLTRGVLGVVTLSPLQALARLEAVRDVHQLEPSVREPQYRWLGDDAVFRFTAGGAGELTLGLALPESAPWPANGIAIALAGAAPVRVEVPRGGSRAIVLAIPAGDSRAPLLVEVRADRSFVAAESGLGSDRRRLAVQLTDLRFDGSDAAVPSSPERR